MGLRWNATTLRPLLILASSVLFASVAQAQSGSSAVSVGISAVGVASMQPVDDAYVGSPYLRPGLGGVAPGISVGLNVGVRQFTTIVEFSTAAIEGEQEGRLVGGRATGRVRDSLLTALIGGVAGWARGSVGVLAGISRHYGTPTLDGIPIDSPSAFVNGDNDLQRFAFTSGVDVLQTLRGRTALLVNGRFSVVDRSPRAQEIGLGTRVFRIGVGIRVGLME